MDIGDEVDVKENKNKKQLERERCDEELRQILSTKGGRYFLWRLLSQCNVFGSLSHLTPHQMAVMSGLRDAGIWVMTEIDRVNNSAINQMSIEAKDRVKI